MPFPPNWPPKATNSARSVRVFQKGITTAFFADNGYLFGSYAMVNQPLPYVAPGSLAPVVVPPVAGGGQAPQDAAGGVALPVPNVACKIFKVYNDGAGVIEISFDGVNVHDEILAGQMHEYQDRMECGVALRFPAAGVASAFRLAGW
jgi:hypothetical protein